MASISTPAQAIPQTPSHPSMPISSTAKAVPRSGIRDVFDRALAAMRMSCAKACVGCAHSRNRYEKPVQGKGKTWTGTRKGREKSVQTYLAASFLSSLFGMTQNLSSG